MAGHHQGQNLPPYNYYPYVPNYLPPLTQQARLPAHTAQYLLGLTKELPPLSGREVAVAGMHSALDSGAFEGFEPGEYQIVRASVNTVTEQHDSKQFKWAEGAHHHLPSPPSPGPNGAAMTDATLTINHRDLNAGDLLARIRANMQVCDDVPLGWRLSNEAKNAICKLQTADDAQLAVDTLLQKLDNPLCRNEVMLKIADCREKEKPASMKPVAKATELAYREELTIVKDKLCCQSANHTYCYVPTTGPRDITFWAREMKNGNVPRDCSTAPNSIKTDEIMAKHEECKQCTSHPRAGTHVDVNPHIHISLADTPLGQVYRPQCNGKDHTALGKRPREESPTDDEPTIVAINELLVDLDRKMPAVGFLGHKGALKKAEILYCHQLLNFAEHELIDLGIGHGPVKDLIRGAKKILRVKKQQQRDEDKENVPNNDVEV
ncbi:hypothetical protein DFH08DRAFT_951145 [Mycena albidolilacea]|uniref:Uncharacterized protein n=1 Tax=Mycena albidolilacea TaxID=1033008 RepID=A0AAD7F0U5_9AGAR|nr:hypothetical protein DFH08DRAFT_951145 [Mycena albidolilacea]